MFVVRENGTGKMKHLRVSVTMEKNKYAGSMQNRKCPFLNAYVWVWCIRMYEKVIKR